MPNTYTQIHLQVVFTVQNRECLMQQEWREDLYRYMTGIIQNYGHKVLAINGMPDHLHVLLGMRPTQSLADLMRELKGDSSKWINENRLVMGRFSWQEGYGAFSYSKSHVPAVIEYIRNQQEHHRNKSFILEYHEFLQNFGIEFDERYSFVPVEYRKDTSGT
jgi:putative transposase